VTLSEDRVLGIEPHGAVLSFGDVGMRKMFSTFTVFNII
jgi:hypothetical protein